jgi:hypothetical protein
MHVDHGQVFLLRGRGLQMKWRRQSMEMVAVLTSDEFEFLGPPVLDVARWRVVHTRAWRPALRRRTSPSSVHSTALFPPCLAAAPPERVRVCQMRRAQLARCSRRRIGRLSRRGRSPAARAVRRRASPSDVRGRYSSRRAWPPRSARARSHGSHTRVQMAGRRRQPLRRPRRGALPSVPGRRARPSAPAGGA